MGVTIDDARAIAATLPRSYEAFVRDRVKFRVGSIVYAAFSHDGRIMGFGFPRDERAALVTRKSPQGAGAPSRRVGAASGLSDSGPVGGWNSDVAAAVALG